MSSAEAGPARATLSRRSMVRGLGAAARRRSGADGLRQRRLPSALRHHRVRRGRAASAWRKSMWRPSQAASASASATSSIFQTTGGGEALPPTHRLEIASGEVVTSTLVKVDGDALGQIYAVDASFRLVDIKSKKVVLQGTSHARAGFERFPVDLLQRARPRGRREPRGQDHRRGSEDPACDLPLGRGLRRGLLIQPSVSAASPGSATSLALFVMSGRIAAANSRMPSMVAIKTHQATRSSTRSIASRRQCCSMDATPAWCRSGPRNSPRRSPGAMTRRARSCASTSRASRTTPTAFSSSCRPRPCSAAARSCAPRPGRRVTAAQLKPLVEGGKLAGSLIVEAGNLRPDDALRALFEKSPAAAAVACFPDEARDLDVVIREVFARPGRADHAGGQAPADGPARRRPGAVARRDREARPLCARQGHDRRGATSRPPSAMLRSWRSTASSWRRAPADVAARSPSATAASPSGESAQAVIAALQRHFLRLHRMRGGARCRPRRWTMSLRTIAPAAAFQATRRDRAAVPRLERSQAQRCTGAHRRGGQGRAPQLRARRRAHREAAARPWPARGASGRRK